MSSSYVSVQSQKTRGVKSLTAILLSLVLVVAFLPSFFFASLGTAFADTQEITGGATISTGGTYKIASDANGCTQGCITVETTEAVTIVGDGIGTGDDLGVASKFGSSVWFDCTKTSSLNLTFKDVFLNGGSHNSGDIINVSGTDNTISFEGTNILDYDGSYNQYCVIHVGKGDAATIKGAGTVYIYKRTAGAGIGGNRAEMNGDITFSMTGSLFLKTSRQAAGIGAGQNASSSTEEPGAVTFNSGTYNLISNARGACIGGAAGSGGGSTGTNVYLNGGNININVDWTGAAIGGGGYAEGNDSSGGKAYFGGASVRVYVDKNAAENNKTAKYWKGVYLTEGINNTAVTAQRLDSTGENAAYMCAIDTTGIEPNAAGNYVIQVDKKTVYTGGLHSYCYLNEHNDKETGEQVSITTTPSNWVSSVDPCLYLYLTGTDHKITVNGKKFTATYNSSAEGTLAECNGGSFTVAAAGLPTYSGGSGTQADPYIISKVSDLEDLAGAVNDGDTTYADTYFKMSEDIDTSSVASWTAIGASAAKSFSGTFDGNGHTVKGLNLVPTGNTGLFGYNTGTIKNITTYGATNGAGTSDNNAIVCGYNDGLVQNCINYGTVTVTSSRAYANGGVVGQNGANGKIYNCANHGNVSAVKHSGGVCGRNYGTINQCFNTATITGTGGGKDGIGGVVGLAGNKNSTYKNTVTNCYNTGAISNNSGRWFGGIVGMADSAATVTNCYNTGTLTAGYSWNWNPIIGHTDGGSKNPIASNNYTLDTVLAGDTDTENQPYTIGTKKTAAEMKTAEFVIALGSAYTVASSGENDGYPVFNIANTSSIKVASDLTYTGAKQTGVVAKNSLVELSGETSATDAGTYKVTAKLTNGATWEDGTTADKEITWTIAKAKLTATYAGETVAANATPALKVDVTGFVNDESATTAADYIAPWVTTTQTLVAGETYTLTPKGGYAKNYDFTYVAGDLVVDLTTVKAAAATTVEGYATDAMATINALANLSETDVAAYKTAIDGYVTSAKSYIETAKTIDEINEAKDDAYENIKDATDDAISTDGTSLDTLKSTASVAVANAATSAKTSINALAELSSDAKTGYIKDVDNAVADAKAAITAATSKAIVELEKTAGVEAVNKVLANAKAADVQALADAKTAATAAINTAAANAATSITGVAGLTDTEKANYKADVEKAATTARKAIEEAATSAAISTAQASGEKTITDIVSAAGTKSTDNLTSAKAQAKTALNNQLASNTKEVKALEGLTETQVTNIVATMQNAIDCAATTIEAAISTTEIDSAKQSALSTLETTLANAKSTAAAAKALSDAKAAATEDINTALANAKTTINALAFSTDSEKSTKVKEAEKLATDALTKLARTYDADQITTDAAAAVKAINEVATTAKSADTDTATNAQAAAKTAIEDAIAPAKSAIDALGEISSTQRAAYKKAIDEAADAAKTAVANAKSTDAVAKAKTEGLASIEAIPAEAKAADAKILSDAKADAKAEIAAQLKEDLAAIDALADMTANQIATAKAAMNKAADAAYKAIDEATTTKAVSTAKTDALGSIDTAKTNAQATSDKAPYLAGKTITSGNFVYTVLADRATVSVKALSSAKANIKTVKIASTVKDAKGNVYKVTEIAAKAFKGCTNLTKVSGGANLVKIGDKVFSGCSKLAAFTCSSKVLSTIGANAFYKTVKLTKVTIKSTTKLATVTHAFKKAGKLSGKKLTVKVAKAKKAAYSKLIAKKGENKNLTVK